jgi:hypothetical protein
MFRIRLCRGEMVVELEGDADAVQAQLALLQSEGYGRLLEFFGLGTQAPARRPPVPEPPADGAIPLAPIAEPALSLRFLLDRIILPRSTADFAADLDGNGNRANAFGGLIAALTASNLDVQASVDAGTASFASPVLLTFNTEEFDLTIDQRADVRIEAGTVVDAAERKFEVDASQPAALLTGWLRGGMWRSQAPSEGGTRVAVAVRLDLSGGAPAVLVLQAAQVSFTLPADGSAILDGQLAGALASDDVDRELVPALAQTMTAAITDADGSEAATVLSPLLRAALAPEVALEGGEPDALSVGIGFRAGHATF